MNAPYDPALMSLDCGQQPAGAVEAADIRPESVRLSSRLLGWRPLNIERREVEPGGNCLPGGMTEHLIFVSLADGHLIRESGGEISDSDFETGHVSIHPGNRPVRWAWDTRLSFAMLALEPEYLDKVAREVFDLDPAQVELLTVERQRDPVITGIAGNLMREVMSADAGSRLYAESLADVLAVHLVRNYTQHPGPIETDRTTVAPRGVTQAVNFIHENYAKDMSLADMAAAAHLSPYHLTRVFKKATGVSPHQYLLQVRVNSARSLLTAGAGGRSLAEVAAAVGFSDQSHLTRHFKRMLGVTPKQLRQ
jgi:AraC family transcriptional regulator